LNTVPTKARGVCSVQRIAGSLEPELFLRRSTPEFKLFAQVRSNYLYRHAQMYKNVELTPSVASHFPGDGRGWQT